RSRDDPGVVAPLPTSSWPATSATFASSDFLSPFIGAAHEHGPASFGHHGTTHTLEDLRMADAPDYLAVDHISITVSDMEASLRFYVEQLGMPVMTDVETSDKTSNDSRYRPLYDTPHPMRRLVVLGPVGDVKVALIAHPGDTLQGEGDPLLDRVGLNHYAL